MHGTKAEQVVIDRLVQWAGQREPIRAMLLYSSRANPDAPVDLFSDYDVLLAVTDIHPFHRDDRWLEDFGKVLVVFRNPIGLKHGFESFGFITHYEDGTKIDYAVFPVEFVRWVAGEPRLPDDLDNGYAVLLDKDGLTAGFKPPTGTAYTLQPPAEQDYRALIEEFFNDAAYVAKNLWRDNLLPMKYSLDYIMKYQCLRKMLEWRTVSAHHGSIKPGAHGKGLKKRVESELWAQLESTYVGAGIEENWEAMFKTIVLFRRVAIEVADHLGYAYLHDLDRHVVEYLHRVKNLDKRAQRFT